MILADISKSKQYPPLPLAAYCSPHWDSTVIFHIDIRRPLSRDDALEIALQGKGKHAYEPRHL